MFNPPGSHRFTDAEVTINGHAFDLVEGERGVDEAWVRHPCPPLGGLTGNKAPLDLQHRARPSAKSPPWPGARRGPSSPWAMGAGR